MAELKETLGNLSNVMDRLVEVVSKEDTAKSIMELLKEKSGVGRASKEEPPTSNERADALFPTVTRRQQAPGGRAVSGEMDLNYWQMSRLRTAFQALTGDIGAFQRTVLNTIVWANKASRVGSAQEVVSTGTSTGPSPIKNYRQAENWLMDKLIREKGLGPGMQAFLNKTTPSGDKMLELLRAGVPLSMAQKTAQRLMQEDIIKEAQAATRRAIPAVGAATAARAAASAAGHLLPTRMGGGGGSGGVIPPGIPAGIRGTPQGPVPTASTWTTWTALAAAGATTLALSTPIIVSKIAKSMSDSQISSTRERFGTLDAGIAGTLVQYDISRIMRDIRMAPKVAESFKSMVNVRQEFDKTMEPIEIAWEKLKNITSEFFLNWGNQLMKPVADMIRYFDKSSGVLPWLNPEELKAAKKEADAVAAPMPLIAGPEPPEWAEMRRKQKEAELLAIANFTPQGRFLNELITVAPLQRFVP